MAYPQDFFQEYGASVASVTIILLTLITTFHILGITFAEPEVEVIDKIVTIENFQTPTSGKKSDTMKDKARHRQSILGGACMAHSNDPHGMEDYCTGLSDDGCGALTCCVWLNNSMCVAGDEVSYTSGREQRCEILPSQREILWKCTGKN
jgi:hypothetical protein